MNAERVKLVAAVLVAAIAVYLLGVHVVERWGPGAGPAMTREQAGQILAELQALRRELSAGEARPARGRREAPQVLRVAVEGRPARGEPDAPVTLVEFTDYQCPYCRRFHQQTYPALEARYIDTGRLRYVVADLPLSIHDQAVPAARAAHCAAEQGRYFEMGEALFRNGARLSADVIAQAAADVGLDLPPFRECLDSDRYAEAVRDSVAEARRLGITGTPSFVLGPTGDGATVEGRRIVGAQPTPVFERAIEQALQQARQAE